MTKKEKQKQEKMLLQSLEWWTNKRAEAIKAGDEAALAEAEAGRDNTTTELLKIQPKSKN